MKTRKPRDRRLKAAIGLMVVVVLPAALPSPGRGAVGTTTRWRLSTGYDTHVYTYHLATDDTTETIGEFAAGAAIDIRSAPRVPHQWHLRAELNAGSQLCRELVDLGYRWRSGSGAPRVRADLVWAGRQHRPGSDHALSSNNHETRAELRLYPWRPGSRMELDLRLRGRVLDHQRPSVLEQNQRDLGFGVTMACRDDYRSAWRIGLLAASRTYPDSTAIDRRTLGIEGQVERSGPGGDFWLYHRSDSRRVADPLARPSAWMHWSELRLALPVGAGRIVANLNSEVWRYERQTSVWFNAWRINLETGYRWGGLLGLQRHLLLTLQHLAAGSSPETHTQSGVRGSIEGHATALSGILALELGRRWYRHRSQDQDSEDDLGLDHPDALALAYSDFTYLELWIMATWEMNARLSLELTASYQPEHHTERSDNLVLGYGSLRLVWRP